MAAPRFACSYTSATALIGLCIRVDGVPSLAHLLRLVSWWGLPCPFAFIKSACQAFLLVVCAHAKGIIKGTCSACLARMVR